MSKSLVTESAEELTGMAERDIVNAKLLFEKKFYPENYMYTIICFHSSQAVEKLLKSFIINNRKPVEKIHDLDNLHQTAVLLDNSFETIKSDCMLINTFAQNIKYSSKNVITKQDINKIIKALETICNFPPIKTMRDSFSKEHNYEIISEITTDQKADETPNIPQKND